MNSFVVPLASCSAMLACVRTAAVFGIDASTVDVEVDVSFGTSRLHDGWSSRTLPCAKAETVSVVRIRNSGFEFPEHRITVNLAPADIRKAGSSFDLPIALGVLAATGIVHPPRRGRCADARRAVARRRDSFRHEARCRLPPLLVGSNSTDSCSPGLIALRQRWSKGCSCMRFDRSTKRWLP